MIVAGLLSSHDEAREIQFIINVCTVRDRIHLVIRQDAIRRLLEQEGKHHRTRSRKP